MVVKHLQAQVAAGLRVAAQACKAVSWSRKFPSGNVGHKLHSMQSTLGIPRMLPGCPKPCLFLGLPLGRAPCCLALGCYPSNIICATGVAWNSRSSTNLEISTQAWDTLLCRVVGEQAPNIGETWAALLPSLRQMPLVF